MAVAAALLCGCQKMNDLESRMKVAENDISTLKSDVAKLNAAVEKNYSITGMTETAEGYTITLSNGTTITLKNGKDGTSGEAVIKIGYVSPVTGPLSHFSVGMDNTIKNVEAKMNEKGYDIGGVHYSVKIIKGDSESDPVKAAEVAKKLVQSDGCQIL